MAKHIPVPVEVAKRISDDYEKDIVIVLAWQRSSALIHTTTYGKTAEDKIASAVLGNSLTAAMGCDMSKSTIWEDFRLKPTALAKEHMEKAMELLQKTVDGTIDITNLKIQYEYLSNEVFKSYQAEIVKHES